MEIDKSLLAQLKRLCEALDKQAARVKILDAYYEGNHPIPKAVRENKATNAYKTLMSMAQADWPKLIVDSVEERMEIQRITFTDNDATDVVWDDWQRNGLDADSVLAHQGALAAGRAYAIVWGDSDGDPIVTPEHASTTIVEYAAGSRRKRAAALRRWFDADADRWYATIYRPDGLYKFQAKAKGHDGATDAMSWEMRVVPDEDWPLDNPLGVVPVVEISVNRSLKMERFGTGRGEFEAATAHIDRINYTTFSLLSAMTWSGFPFRVMIGDPVTRDDDGKPLAPFDVAADRIAQIENPDGKMIQLPEAALTNYGHTLEMFVKHLAATTKTPAHYLLGEMVNLSADAIRAGEAGLISKVRRHFRPLGESWEEIARLMLAVRGHASAADYAAETDWKDPESRSMAERADAAVKLNGILPWQAIAARVLGASPQEMIAWEAQRSIDQMIAAPPESMVA